MFVKMKSLYLKILKFAEFFATVTPFVSRMPNDVKNDFMDSLMEETLKEETVLFRKNDDSSKEDKIFDLHKFIILHIKKPE